MKIAKRWEVRYLPFGAQRHVVRRFPTESRARAFYRRLWTRREPPTEQTIKEMEIQ